MVVNIGTDTDHFIEIEEVHNELLNELQYVVKWDKQHSFVMAFNNKLGCLQIQGPAPNGAKEKEDVIDSAIDCYNNGFY